MPTAATLVAFAAASITLLLIPGPAVFYIVNRSLSDGRAVALTAVAGIELGSFLHVVAATVGLSAILATSAVAFSLLKWLGVAYLVSIGIRTLRTRPVPLAAELVPTTRRRAFGQGILVQVLNPKVALFFLSFLPQFIDPERGPAWTQSLILGTVFFVLACVLDGCYALAASALRTVLLRGRGVAFVRRWVAGVTYLVLGALASTASPAAAAKP
jgi:threonine/homoserine/homoserine lactone efflux protein